MATVNRTRDYKTSQEVTFIDLSTSEIAALLDTGQLTFHVVTDNNNGLFTPPLKVVIRERR
jgi:hypothetical protein